jgi:hypothetical protein
LVTSGAPRCPHCGADLQWGEDCCPYCGSSLLPCRFHPSNHLFQGPFPRSLQLRRQGRWQVSHCLFDGKVRLGCFTQYWHGGVTFQPPQGKLYRTRGGRMVRLRLLWQCGPQVVGWVEQDGLWVRRYNVVYGGNRYLLLSLSPMSRSFMLRDESGARLIQMWPASRSLPPRLTICAPLPLELLGQIYAAALVLWRQVATA